LADLLLLATCNLFLVGVGLAPTDRPPFVRAGNGFAPGFDTITEAELEHDVRALASPELEGRDTPSLGLERAARLIEERFKKAGLAYAPDSSAAFKKVAGTDPPAEGNAAGTAAAGTFRRPFERHLPEPDPSGCALLVEGADSSKAPTYAMLRDFVPVHGCEGEAAGEIVFAGYGIQSKTEKYDDLAGLKIKGRIALIVEGEPRTTDRRFEGVEISRSASLWEKIDALSAAGAAGVLAARRPSLAPAAPSAKEKPAAAPEISPGLSFRSAWAEFNGVASDPPPKHALPALEVTLSCASELLGQDVEALAEKIDKGVHPVHVSGAGKRVRLRSRTVEKETRVDNLVGLVRGDDANLSGEYIVVGAHYDHVGIDARGRIACGADDNASGVAGMLEIAEALATAGPRRSVLCCAFAGEEEGLLGSHAFCAALPVPKEKLVAMVNLDMIGRGDATEVAALGVVQNPGFEKVIQRAKKLRASGVREVVVRQGEDLFQRSDHYSFHKIGVPALFFFEGLPIDRNKDYHTWRDTADKIDYGKMQNTAKLVFNVAWILAQDDERPPPPRD
jgi:hypothetical protein